MIDPVVISPPAKVMTRSPALRFPVVRSPSVAKPTLPAALTFPTVIDVPDLMPTEKFSSGSMFGPAVMSPSTTAPSALPLTRVVTSMFPPVTDPPASNFK